MYSTKSSCGSLIGDSVAVSAIQANPLTEYDKLEGHEISVRGFVDALNLYGDASAKTILGAWWGGAGPTPGIWRFDLETRTQNMLGQVFRVYVPNDAGRDALLQAFVANVRERRTTRVFVKGRLMSLDACTDFAPFTPVSLYVRASSDIRLESG